MNTHAKIGGAVPAGISQAEWQARIDLAAVYRLLAHYGWDDVIYNHSSMRVPGEPRNFLMKKHELLYAEVTASNLVKVNMDQDLDEKSGVNRPGFTLHGGVLSARPDVNCAVHVHTENGMALAGLKHGLRMVSQQAIRFYQRIGYHKYEGITEDFAERARINADLGKNRAMILIDLMSVAIADRSFSPKEREQFHRIGTLLGFPGARVDELIHMGDEFLERMEHAPQA